MIGRYSITKRFIVSNKEDIKKPFFVTVQATKNYSICDFLLPEEKVDLRSELLNEFQGRQLFSRDTCIHLQNVLYALFNPNDNDIAR